MKKHQIIDMGIIAVCIVTVYLGFLGIAFIEPIFVVGLMLALSLAIVVSSLTWLIYDGYKDKLPWRKHGGEHQK